MTVSDSKWSVWTPLSVRYDTFVLQELHIREAERKSLLPFLLDATPGRAQFSFFTLLRMDGGSCEPRLLTSPPPCVDPAEPGVTGPDYYCSAKAPSCFQRPHRGKDEPADQRGV